MLTVTRKFSFEYAHHLPNYEGNCKNLHGHNGIAEITVTGMIDKKSGMIIDFKLMKQDLSPVFEKLDHHYLNDIIEIPTAENITKWLVDEIRKVDIFYKDNLETVRVYETPDCFCEWSK